jgi:prophage regulatory protein
MHQLYRLPAVRQFLGLSRTRIFELITEGKFPPPIKIGDRAIAWLEEDLKSWQQARVTERDQKRRRFSVRSCCNPSVSPMRDLQR